MTKDMLLALARHGATLAGSALVTDGLLQSSQLRDFEGAILVIVAVAWSLWEKYNAPRT